MSVKDHLLDLALCLAYLLAVCALMSAPVAAAWFAKEVLGFPHWIGVTVAIFGFGALYAWALGKAW